MEKKETAWEYGYAYGQWLLKNGEVAPADRVDTRQTPRIPAIPDGDYVTMKRNNVEDIDDTEGYWDGYNAALDAVQQTAGSQPAPGGENDGV